MSLKRRTQLCDPRWLVVFSLIVAVILLSVTKRAMISIQHQRMIKGANSSYRMPVSAPNLLIMHSDSEYVGASKVYVRYLIQVTSGFSYCDILNQKLACSKEQLRICSTVFDT